MVQNTGNTERLLELSVLALPEGWRWRYGDEGEMSVLTMAPHSTASFDLFIAPPKDAMPQTQTVKAVIVSEFCINDSIMVDSHKFNVDVTVSPVYGLVIDSTYPIAKAEPGSDTSFNISIINIGTAVDKFTLLLGELPQGVLGKFIRTPDGEVSAIEVPGRSVANVTLLLTMPDRLKTAEFGFWVGARSDKAGTMGMDLIVELRLADLRIKDIEFDDKNIKDGDVRKANVKIANNGDAGAKGGEVEVNGETKTFDVAAGKETVVTFDIKFHSDDRAIVAVVDPVNAVQEKREDNNDYVTEIKVQKGFELVPGFQSAWIFIAIGGVFILSTIKPLMIRKRNR